MSTFLRLRLSVVRRASFGTVSGRGFSCAPLRSSVAANSISPRSDDWAMPMVSLASGSVEFEKVDSELTMVVVESGEMSESLEHVYRCVGLPLVTLAVEVLPRKFSILLMCLTL